jgi:tetratricopeptide (TPR) repeat protein
VKGINKIILRALCFYLAFSAAKLPAQDPAIDSLKLALKKAKHDTTRCSILNELVELTSDDEWPQLNEQLLALSESNFKKNSNTKAEQNVYRKCYSGALFNVGFLYSMRGDLDKAIGYYERSLKMDEEAGDKMGVAKTLNNIGLNNHKLGNISKALSYYKKSLKIQEEIKDVGGIAASSGNMGSIYLNQGDISKALDCYSRNLKIQEEIGDKRGFASSLGNIAYIHESQGNIPQALEFYTKSLKTWEEIGEKQGIALAYNNLGSLYDHNGDPSVTSSKKASRRAGSERALECYRKSLRLNEEVGDRPGVALALNNIGFHYDRLKDKKKALEYYSKCLAIREETGEKASIAHSLNNCSNIFYLQKNYGKALSLALRSMNISKDLGFPNDIENAANNLHLIYKATGDYNNALKYYELRIKMRDSINNESTRKASIRSQLKYEYEKQAAADSVEFAKEGEIKSAELSRQSAEIKVKKNQQYALFGGLFLVILFSIFMFNRFKITQKQKVLIEHQKEMVEEQKKIVDEKQREVLESIHYAKRIQLAQIPSEKMVWTMITKTKRK